MKRKLFIFSILAVLLPAFSLTLAARDRSAREAESLAQQFFQQFPSTKASSGLELVWDGEDPATRSSQTPAFYVFNRGRANGFVIISADEGTAPVLAYAQEGSFSVEGMPQNVRAWMRALKEQSRGCRDSVKSLAVSGEVDLDTPDYNQDDPYNAKCPELMSGWRAYTGCAITATAIVMGYHRWPDSGTGTIPVHRVNGQPLGPFVLGDPYNWDSMDDVATIMVQLGAMAHARYDYTGTSARLQTIAEELPKYMKYNPRLRYLERANFAHEEWDRMLRAEIDAGRPVIYEGYDTSEGHAVVVDGYNDQGFFNINWGWGGYCNGFYQLDHMNPDGSGIGGNSSGGYSLAQGGIFEVRPRQESDGSIDMVEYIHNQSFPDGIVVTDLVLPLKPGDSFGVEAGIIKNFGTNAIRNDFKVVVTDIDGQVIEELFSSPAYPLEPFSTQLAMDRRQTVTVTKEVKPGYRLRIVFLSEETGRWVPITCPESVGKWEIVLNEEIAEPAVPVDEATTMRYEKKTGKVIIVTLPDATVTLKEQQSGKEVSSVLQREGETWSFVRSALPKGVYLLSVRSGADVKELILEL